MDFSRDSPSAIAAGFFLDFNASEGMLLEDYSKPAINPIRASDPHRRSPICRMSLSSIDRMSQALFRLFHAARDARVAGKAIEVALGQKWSWRGI